MSRRRDAQAGFTVIELMIAMLIMLIVTVPLVTSFVLGVRATRESNQDVQDSVDAQLLAAYFDIDVAGSEQVKTTSGSCAIPAGGTAIVTLTSTDPGAPKVLTYATEPDSETQAELALSTTVYKLQRIECATAGGSDSTTTVARQLIQNGTVAPARVRCDQLTTCSATPRTVTLLLQESSKLFMDKATPNVFTYGVTAVRRVTS
jgi:prepilin-type N-terminal cleavage/methylation domain-containing protein